MKKLLKRLINYFGYEIRRLDKDASELFSGPANLQEYFALAEGMISFEEASLLYNFAKQISDGCIVEVGSYRGRSAVALGRGSLDGNRVPVYAIEPHEEFTGVLGGRFGPADRGAFYKAMIDTSCYQVVRLVNLSSEIVAPNWNKKIGLLWIDGDHTYSGVKRDFECWLPHLTPEAIIAFDDSTDPDLGPRQLINELLNTNKFQELQQVGKVTVIRSKKI
jgi:predicted O-methyltransferase YrrM